MTPLTRAIYWLSIVVTLAVAVVWARSYFYSDSVFVRWTRDDQPFRAVAIATGSGNSWLYYMTGPTVPVRFGITIKSEPKPHALRFTWGLLGFRVDRFHDGLVMHMPIGWFAAAATLPAFIIHVLALRRCRQTAKRQAAGQCLACGYDMRASPERCPECGAVTPS